MTPVQQQHPLKGNGKSLSASEAARLIGKHRNTLMAWIAKGCPTVAPADRATGREWQLDLGQVLEWRESEAAARTREAERQRSADLEERLRVLEGTASDGCSIEEARRRRAVARARMDELEAQYLEGRVLDADEAQRAMVAVMTITRDRLLGMHRGAAPYLVGLATPAEGAAVVEKFIHEALHEIADVGEKAAETIKRVRRDQAQTPRRKQK